VNYRILLVGLGQLGSRYLQGIEQYRSLIGELVILEPLDKAYEQGISLLSPSNVIQGDWISRQGINNLKGEFDLAIIATPSSPRPKIVAQIIRRVNVRSWILEKVLGTSLQAIRKLCSDIGSTPAWVNTPRRLTSLYNSIKTKLPQDAIEFTVRSRSFALGCNSIHFIDTVEWLTNEPLVSIEIEALSDWYDSKRSGYKEFDGRLVALYASGSRLVIDNICDGLDEGIDLLAKGRHLTIDETRGFFEFGKLVPGRVEYQSELSGRLVQYILKRGECSLPTLNESARQHRSFLGALNRSPRLMSHGKGSLPIT